MAEEIATTHVDFGGATVEGAGSPTSSINKILMRSVIAVHMVVSILYILLVAILSPIIGKSVRVYLPGDESVCILGLILVVGHVMMTSMAFYAEKRKKPDTLFLWLAYLDTSILVGVALCLYAYFADSVKITVLLKFIVWFTFLIISHAVTQSRIHELDWKTKGSKAPQPQPDTVSLVTMISVV